MARIYLDVPFAEKDAAKASGARWDPNARRWYAPRPDMPDLARWTATTTATLDVLPGEDRSFHGGPPDARIFVDLVPSSCWFTNVRTRVSNGDWDRLRRMVYARAGNRCEACGSPGDRSNRIWLEAHERWDYDPNPAEPPFADLGIPDLLPVQRLRRLICLCTPCHEATHIGLSGLRGRGEAAMDHLRTVNRWTRAQANAQVGEAFTVFEERSKIEWALDLGILLRAGIKPILPG